MLRDKPYVPFPAWYYGPGGASAIFESEETVPPGWHTYDDRHLIREPGAPKPEDGPEAWGGLTRAELVTLIRGAGEKIHANSTPRTLHERAVKLGLVVKPEVDSVP